MPPRTSTSTAAAPIGAACSRLHGARDLRFETETLDPGALAHDQVLCRTRVSAISPGTELAAFNGAPPLRPTQQVYPRLVGYLNVAEVMARGSAVTSVEPGERVLTFTSHRSHYVVDETRLRARVPATVSDEHAALAYLYRLALTGLRRAQVTDGSRVAVFGLGAIGLAAVDLARARGCRVVALSGSEVARRTAGELGAVAARDKRGYDRDAARADLGDLPQAAVSTSNAWDDLQTAVGLLAFNGVLALLGFPGRTQGPPAFNPFDPQYFYDQQLTVTSAGMAPAEPGTGSEDPAVLPTDLADILDRFASGALNPGRLIARRYPWRELEAAYHYLDGPDRAPGTVLLDWT
jgi:threonine dehydrogenase-like Zn-dependent dehydrogenase